MGTFQNGSEMVMMRDGAPMGGDSAVRVFGRIPVAPAGNKPGFRTLRDWMEVRRREKVFRQVPDKHPQQKDSQTLPERLRSI